MFGIFGSRNSSRQTSISSTEEAVKQVSRMWDSSDVEKRAKLLGNIKGMEDDRLFLAIVQAPWSQLPGSTQVKIFELWAKRDAEEHFVKTAGKYIGELISESYSETEFDALFHNHKYPDNWSRDRALSVWYGLGRFCFFISVGQLNRLREQDYEIAVNAGDRSLLSKWNMSDFTRRNYETFGAQKIPLLLPIYRQIDDNEKLNVFFLILMSEMMGNETNISTDDFSQGLLALQLNRIDIDPTILSRVSAMFYRVVEATQLFDKMLPI